MLRGAKILTSKLFLPNMLSFKQDFSQSNSVDRSTAWQSVTPSLVSLELLVNRTED